MMSTEAFFDTNIIMYFASESDVKAKRSSQLLMSGGVVSVQVLNEFARASLAKRKIGFIEVRKVLDAIKSVCTVVPVTIETHERGLAYAERYRLGVYDSMIVAAAVMAGCRTLYSEDMHHSLKIDGLTVKNPYR